MARFTVRIELHNASRDQYTELHEEMAGQGFSDTIQTENGALKKMPPAEYNFNGNVTLKEVLGKAKAAAASVVKDYAVLVTESNGRLWYNLEDA